MSRITQHATRILRHLLGFHTIKSVLALLGADWGCQTLPQAIHKNHCWRHRARHVAIVALIQGTCALYVAINATTHYLIDSYRIPKALDQTLHITVAVATAPLLAPAPIQRGKR
jgi:hypothetical protein